MEASQTVLETVQVDIDAVHPHPKNPRRGDLEVIKESLLEHGQYRAIVVDSQTNDILAGNHTWRSAKELGWEKILAHFVTVTPEGAEQLLLVDNRASDVASYDEEARAKLLENLMVAGKLKGSGYDPESVDDILSGLEALGTVDVEFEGEHRESAEDTASRYREPSEVVAQRQFIIMIPENEAEIIEQQIAALKKGWGIANFRDIVKESLYRCATACADNEEVGCRCLQVVEPSAPTYQHVQAPHGVPYAESGDD